MSNDFQDTDKPSILTNMAFWQSPAWCSATESIYSMEGRSEDPTFLPCWKEVLILLRRAKHFDVIVTMGARESLLYGLLCILTGRPSKQVLSEVFIDDEKKGGLLWRMKTRLYKTVAKRALGILTNSTAEMDSISRRFSVPSSKLHYVPMHSNIKDPEICSDDRGFVLSAGRSLRDYNTLMMAARDIKTPICIVCEEGDIDHAHAPEHVTIFSDISREEYLSKVREASVIAVPLRATERSTGQVVILEAMGLGKPVVATHAPGSVDLIRDGDNGFLIPTEDAEALASAINRLMDNADLRRQIGERSVQTVREQFTFEKHAQSKLQTIGNIWRATL